MKVKKTNTVGAALAILTLSAFITAVVANQEKQKPVAYGSPEYERAMETLRYQVAHAESQVNGMISHMKAQYQALQNQQQQKSYSNPPRKGR